MHITIMLTATVCQKLLLSQQSVLKCMSEANKGIHFSKNIQQTLSIRKIKSKVKVKKVVTTNCGMKHTIFLRTANDKILKQYQDWNRFWMHQKAVFQHIHVVPKWALSFPIFLVTLSPLKIPELISLHFKKTLFRYQDCTSLYH